MLTSFLVFIITKGALTLYEGNTIEGGAIRGGDTVQPKNVSDFYVGVFISIRSSAERRVFRLINSSQEPTICQSAPVPYTISFNKYKIRFLLNIFGLKYTLERPKSIPTV